MAWPTTARHGWAMVEILAWPAEQGGTTAQGGIALKGNIPTSWAIVTGPPAAARGQWWAMVGNGDVCMI